MDLFSIKADPQKLENGSWWRIWRTAEGFLDGETIDEPGDQPAVLIVPAGHHYDRVLEEEREPFLLAIRQGKAGDADRLTIHGRTLARAVWRGAANLTVRGEPFVWSEGAAIALLTDPAWLTLREFIARAAQIRAAAAVKEEELAAKN